MLLGYLSPYDSVFGKAIYKLMRFFNESLRSFNDFMAVEQEEVPKVPVIL